MIQSSVLHMHFHISAAAKSLKSTGGGNGYPLQYSCLENSMDRGIWRTTVHGVTKSWKLLSDQQIQDKEIKSIPVIVLIH